MQGLHAGVFGEKAAQGPEVALPQCASKEGLSCLLGREENCGLRDPPLALRSGPRCPESPRLQEFGNALCELLSSTAPPPRFPGLQALRPVVTLPLHFPPGPLSVPRSFSSLLQAASSLHLPHLLGVYMTPVS